MQLSVPRGMPCTEGGAKLKLAPQTGTRHGIRFIVHLRRVGDHGDYHSNIQWFGVVLATTAKPTNSCVDGVVCESG